MGMNVGAIVEYLISIKDMNKGKLTSDEIDAINDACNILSHRFPRMKDAESLINETLAGYEVSNTEAMDWLHEAGYAGNESNLAYLMAQEMPEAMALCMRHKAQEVLQEYTRIYRKELERL